MSLSISYLEDVLDSEKLTVVLKEVISIFLRAVDDWPSPITRLEDYEGDVYRLIKGEVKRKMLQDFIAEIDTSKYAWEAESLSQLIEVFNFYEEGKSLKYIVKELEEKIKEQHFY